MKIRVVCVGKPRERALVGLHDEYAGRIRQLGVEYETGSVAEVRAEGKYSDDHVRERESRALLGACEDKGELIALDRTGRLMSSEQVAAGLERWAAGRAQFLVGGPLGHHTSLLRKAGQVWSLSPLTFPHELVRVILAEQLYRALTILRGLPYHK
jgi:23S rRNA (pseudouridine1915-N3)-methyltransferase